MIDDSDDKEKSFIVTEKFKVSGNLPDFINKEHIESNIQSEIEDAIGEIALSSEYYDMSDDIEWGVFLDGRVNVESESFEIEICEDPFCEHCGPRFSDFAIMVNDDGTSCCFDCFLSGRDDFFSKEELDELYEREKKERRGYLLRKLHELESEDED